MKEVPWAQDIPKAEFTFAREFMAMKHNYLCAVCKERSAVQETNTGILQPCWDCQKVMTRIKRKTWFDKLKEKFQ